MLGNAMQGLHSLLSVSLQGMYRRLEAKIVGCQNTALHWVRAASAHPEVQRGPTHAGVSTGRLLSIGSSPSRKQAGTGFCETPTTLLVPSMRGEMLGKKATVSIRTEAREPLSRVPVSVADFLGDLGQMT